MLRSMTGFGRAEGETGLGRLSVECRSINHRYSDISVKLPKRLLPFESRVKEVVRSKVARGRVDVAIRVDALSEDKVQFTVDLHVAQQYYSALQSLKGALGLKDEVTLQLLSGAKDLIQAKEDVGDIEPYWAEIVPILTESLQGMDGMRRAEGETLEQDLRQRTGEIGRQIAKVKERFSTRVKDYRDQLRERILGLLEGMEIDSYRLQQEIAFLAERMDITEEIVRAESHLAQFSNLLSGKEAVGRKMDFLLQEIHREVNTISAKANDAEISQTVVEVKSELEKIREQAQNIE
jgi:uncharacterized protein (TIGR00255 family)